jgi:predicted permease
MARGQPMTTLLHDIRYGMRMLRKSPNFTLVAVLTLALGIGANTALFSVVNGVLLNPLPYPHSEQLVTLHESKPNFSQGSVSFPNFLDWQKDNHTFSSMAIMRPTTFSLTGAGDAQQIKAEFISSDFFAILDVKPLLGRTLLFGEDRIGAAPIALITEGLWQQKFSGSRDIVNKTITLDGTGYTVVGILPESFRLFERAPEVYVPIGQWTNPLLKSRAAGLGIHGIGRLKPGVTMQQAQADMDAITRSLALAYPEANKSIGCSLVPLKELLVGDVKPFLLVLLAAVGFVLLIACVNVANLLLARSTARIREFAVRTALGASRTRIVWQLLTESVLIALAGGALGVIVASYGTRAALGMLPRALPRAESVSIDAHVLIFTTTLTLLAGILSGVLPALLRTSRMNLHDTLKEGGRGASGSRHRTQSIFVVAQMAMALVLLVGAGLMLRSLVRLWHVDPGFRADNVLYFGMSFPPAMNHATPEVIRASYRELERTFAAIPGVQGVSVAWGAFPLSSDDEQLFWFEGQPKPTSKNDMNWAIDYIVSPEYFQTLGIPLLRGRLLNLSDNEHAPRVTVVDDVFARKYFPNQDPIGKRIVRDTGVEKTGELMEIVGVVGHVKQWGLDTDDTQALRSQFYMNWMQMPDEYTALYGSGSSMVIHSDGRDPEIFNALRRASQQMNAEQVVFGAESMNQMVAESLASQRFSMILLSLFATLALLLASIGIYSVISYVAGERTREIGVRMALGAARIDILRMVLGNGGKLLAIGVGAGIVAAFALTRLMSSLLYGIRATDPLTFAVVTLLLTAVALLACYLPARRAATVDPIVALRDE